MNSDEIERLQRASVMTAPEVSRSAGTLLPRPSCASTIRERRDASRRTVQVWCNFAVFWGWAGWESLNARSDAAWNDGRGVKVADLNLRGCLCCRVYCVRLMERPLAALLELRLRVW